VDVTLTDLIVRKGDRMDLREEPTRPLGTIPSGRPATLRAERRHLTESAN
jgi:hypothetical protein